MKNENKYQGYLKQTQNSSGEGVLSQVPKTIENEFNWGAFFLTWIW